jgi:predicted metal-dependent enzyme (double-stranded beta helix superfamily)
VALAKEGAMKDDAYTLARFVGDLRRVTGDGGSEQELLARLRPLVQRFAGSGTWRDPHHYEVNSDQGFGVHLLHEEPDHSLAVFAASWLPGRGTPPHDHGVWGIVVGVDGAETNVFWERTDDRSLPGHAELRKIGEKVFHPGDVIAMPTGTIHSVSNESDQVTLSLHVYGKHINFTQRSQFNPDERTEKPFLLKID